MKKIMDESHHDQVVLFDPACASQNIGDEIISSSAQRWLNPLFEDDFIIRVSTHQKMSFRYRRYLNESKAYFVLGSNLLKSGMLFGFRQWDISLIDTLQIRNAVLVGCGWHAYEKRVGAYSSLLYGRILSKQLLHSVRDEYTKAKLGAIGFSNVLNTGCATMWGFTPDFCKQVPREKASNVITTITDYNQDPVRDEQMLSTLLSEYDSVSIWLQGNGDRRYASSLPSFCKCKVIPSTLAAFDEVLKGSEVDFVGTRLHGGIRALQHGRRTLIIAIDNRAREKHRDFNIPTLERDDMDRLGDWIGGSYPTEIRIPLAEIEKFLNQFKS